MTRQDCLNKILLLSDLQLEELINSHEALVEKKQLGGPFNYINPVKAPQAIQAIKEDPNAYILENVYPSTYTDILVWSDLLSNSKGNLQMVNKYAPLFLEKGKEYYQGLEDTTDEDPSASSPNEDKMTLWTIPNNAVWSHYLGHDDFMPEGTRFLDLFPVSLYKPTIAKDENAIYYSDPYLKYNPHILADLLYAKEYGPNDHKFRDMLLNDYIATLGEDEKGKYYSYYDKWNINPFRGSEALPIGSWFGLDKYDDISEFTNLKTLPIEFYDRFYYTPEMELEAREIFNSTKNYTSKKANGGVLNLEEELLKILPTDEYLKLTIKNYSEFNKL